MRLSEWRQKAPFKDSASAKVMTAIEQAIVALGADEDPECWVAWGDDPRVRYLVFVAAPAGLLQIHVRVNVPGEGPRAGGKLVRWNRVQLGELGVEIQGGHRLVSFQVETQVLNGVDAVAEQIGAFAQSLFAALDGRTAAPPTTSRGTTAKATAKAGTRSAGAGKAPTRSAGKAPAMAPAKAPGRPSPSKPSPRLSSPKGPAR